MQLFWTLFAIVSVFCIYLLPAIVANARGRPNSDAITVFNLLLGWTIIGWVLSLIWAMTSTNSQLAQAATPQNAKPAPQPVPLLAETATSWRAPVMQGDGEASQAVIQQLVEGDRVQLFDLKDRIAVRFNDETLGVLDAHDEKIARAHVAKAKQVFARVAAVTNTSPKRLILTISVS